MEVIAKLVLRSSKPSGFNYWKCIKNCKDFHYSSRRSTLADDCISNAFNGAEANLTFKENFISRSERMRAKARGRVTELESRYGVLIPLCTVNGKYSLVFTKRSTNLSKHAGEVSFPGGRMDKSDKSPTEAALREAEEELGLNRTKVEVWTTLIGVPDKARSGSVTPVVGMIGEIDITKLKKNDLEVSDVFTLPLSHLLAPENQGFTQFKSGYRMPVFINGPHRIWGLTAILTDILLANLFPSHYKLKIQEYKGDLRGKHVGR